MLTLASRLRALDDAALRRAIEARMVSPTGIKDFFDLAEALLDPVAIQNALAHLDRSTLAVLAIAGEAPVSDDGASEESAGAALAGPVMAAADHADATAFAPTTAEIAARLSILGERAIPVVQVEAAATQLDSLLLAIYSDGRLKPYDAVSAHLASWPAQGLPSALMLASVAAPPSFAPPTDTDTAFTTNLAAERAFTAVSSLAELVSEISREPVHELSRGGLGLPDTKRLAAAAAVEVEAVPTLVALTARAELIAKELGYWRQTELGEAWLMGSTAHRWSTLAASWRASLPTDVLDILPAQAGVFWDGELRDFLGWLYPAGGTWLDDRVTAVQAEAEFIGITAHHTTSAAGGAVLAGAFDEAVAIMEGSLPAEVGAVYLQHDLSIVSPGPLAPSIDARLRALADVESRELASSYRITAASVNRALAGGETAETLLEFLRSISLTGIPQPLDYLIRESASRYGRVRVLPASAGDAPVQSVVRSDDPALLGTIEVDQTLTPLGLHRISSDRLGSRFPVDVVFWALSDSRYPVAAENEAGEIVHVRRIPLAQKAPVVASDPAVDLVERLRTSDGGEGKAAGAWLARQLDAAIRTKQTITVSIAMPGGVVVDYLLEPASVGGGRFRARDRRADIERTLPISSIVSISPAP
ncbi:helicase-associated domain-containing protein [Leifsonia sp. YAF41]|uniref:helicase-associated domain-containing protein n=1 Tax=Leifsonia sp. YAF41 TaxID=3233086 RepID=UPI003F9688EC